MTPREDLEKASSGFNVNSRNDIAAMATLIVPVKTSSFRIRFLSSQDVEQEIMHQNGALWRNVVGLDS